MFHQLMSTAMQVWSTRRRLSDANRLSEHRAIPVKDSAGYGWATSTDEQSGVRDWRSDQPETKYLSEASARSAEYIPIEPIRLVSLTPKTEINPPSFDGERNLSLFHRQFEEVTLGVSCLAAHRYAATTTHTRKSLRASSKSLDSLDSIPETGLSPWR